MYRRFNGLNSSLRCGGIVFKSVRPDGSLPSPPPPPPLSLSLLSLRPWPVSSPVPPSHLIFISLTTTWLPLLRRCSFISHSLTHSHCHPFFLSLTHSLSLTHTTHSCTHTLSQSHSHTLTHSHAHIQHTHTHTHALTHSHSLSHTHTLTLTLSHSPCNRLEICTAVIPQ